MSQLEKVLYTAKTHTSGGRDGGVSRSADGRLEVKLSSPGGPGSGTNPEQLFAAGWSACFISAMKLVAGKIKVALPPDVVEVWQRRALYGVQPIDAAVLASQQRIADRFFEHHLIPKRIDVASAVWRRPDRAS